MNFETTSLLSTLLLKSFFYLLLSKRSLDQGLSQLVVILVKGHIE